VKEAKKEVKEEVKKNSQTKSRNQIQEKIKSQKKPVRKESQFKGIILSREEQILAEKVSLIYLINFIYREGFIQRYRSK